MLVRTDSGFSSHTFILIFRRFFIFSEVFRLMNSSCYNTMGFWVMDFACCFSSFFLCYSKHENNILTIFSSKFKTNLPGCISFTFIQLCFSHKLFHWILLLHTSFFFFLASEINQHLTLGCAREFDTGKLFISLTSFSIFYIIAIFLCLHIWHRELPNPAKKNYF